MEELPGPIAFNPLICIYYYTVTKDINNNVVISPMLLRTTSPKRSYRFT